MAGHVISLLGIRPVVEINAKMTKILQSAKFVPEYLVKKSN